MVRFFNIWTAGIGAIAALMVAGPSQAQGVLDGIAGRINILAPQSSGPVQLQQNVPPRAMPQGSLTGMKTFAKPVPQAYGSAGLPYTTKGAYANPVNGLPVKIYPFRAAGYIETSFTNSTVASCTASVIAKGLIVTAAHCVTEYGTNGNPGVTQLLFAPAMHHDGTNLQTPYGVWQATGIWVTPGYLNGSDVCSTTSPGVTCENDIAIVSIAQWSGAPYNGKYVGEIVGKFSYYQGNQGYTPFILDPTTRTGQITQLGYPGALENGLRMMRTDSIGIQDNINQVLIGTNQTQGSSGGPYLMNFGRTPAITGGITHGDFDHQNKVIGVASWIAGGAVKVGGSSRFGFNTAFPPSGGVTNIEWLIGQACTALPGNC